jgi:hypothetical protein
MRFRGDPVKPLPNAPLGAGIAYDVMKSYDPLFWAFVLLSALSAGVIVLVRSESPGTETIPVPTPGHATP